MENAWTKEIEKLRAFREEVKRLVEKADYELSTGLVLLPLQDLLADLKDALGDKPTRYEELPPIKAWNLEGKAPEQILPRYEKTYRDGCSGLEECGADRGRVLD